MLYRVAVPTDDYVDRVSRLLFGTCATESLFLYERQQGPAFFGPVGAFGKWQVERASMEASLVMLMTNQSLAKRATSFLFADEHAGTGWITAPINDWLWTLRFNDNDVPSVMFGRLHYLRVPFLIPESNLSQAQYWKRYYNTDAGKGTVDGYMHNWARLCAPIIDLDKEEN